ncbi:MAG: membrane-associated protein [Parcubacteria group bacterium Gr01-1014_8]|nr:MAG: membrane-associated protein [Parcubacteria group bacterium Gr01-1014_8]
MLPYDLGQLIQLIGYPGLFAIIFAESGLIIGFFLPGASLLFTAGFLASQGFLDIRIIVPLVAIAAILGDNVGYWFGAKVGVRFFEKPNSRFFKQEYLERTKRFYAKYGTRTIFFARFVPIVRTFAPILAGVANMDYRTFMFYNMLGGALWASGISYLGYTLGEVLPQTADYIEFVVLAIIFVTTLPLAREFWKHRYSHLKSPRAVLFDLDDTLAESWQPPTPDMVDKLSRLLEHVPVAILSSAGFTRIEKAFLPALEKHPHAKRLYVFSNASAEAHMLEDGSWKSQYHMKFTGEERTKVVAAVKEALGEVKIIDENPKYRPEILERDSKIVFTACGLEATQAEKRAWDPDMTKRKKLKEALHKRLPEFELGIGGTTTIDITPKGINKAYGALWLAKNLGVQPKEMLFIGDAIYPGGNDYTVMEAGVDTRQVQNPAETELLIDKLLETLEKKK